MRRFALSFTIFASVTVLTVFLSQPIRESLASSEDASATNVEKFTPGGPCSVMGVFVKAMACQSDIMGDKCCGGLRAVWDAHCACRPLPGIVVSHAGSAHGFLRNFMRCQYHDDDERAPVDYVTDYHSCGDKKEWCHQLVPNVDVRITSWDFGYVQVADERGQWAYASAGSDNTDDIQETVCKALGFLGMQRNQRNTPMKQFPTATKVISCPPSAAQTGVVNDCSVTSNVGGKPLKIECTGNELYGPQICTRTGMSNNLHNTLECTVTASGFSVKDHTRRIAAPHVVCGTAAVNETRVAWYDGYQDDYDLYQAIRSVDGAPMRGKQTGGSARKGEFTGFEKFTGVLQGLIDLVSNLDSKRAGLQADRTNFEANFPGGLEGFKMLFESYHESRSSVQWADR